MGFSVRIETQGAGSTLILTGELDVAAKGVLQEHVHRLLNRGERELAIDVNELSFCDTSGLAALIVAQRVVRRVGGRLRVVGVTGPVAELLQTTDLA